MMSEWGGIDLAAVGCAVRPGNGNKCSTAIRKNYKKLGNASACQSLDHTQALPFKGVPPTRYNNSVGNDLVVGSVSGLRSTRSVNRSTRRRSTITLGYRFLNAGSAGAIRWTPIGSGAVTFIKPEGSARAAIAACSMSSASRNKRNARSCSSRPSGVRVKDRVVRVNRLMPNCCSSL